MSRVLLFLMVAILMTSPSSSASAHSLGGMAAPGWQANDPANLTESPEAISRLRERLRSLAARQEVEIERDVVYATRGDDKLLMDVYKPAGEGPHAAVLVVHGGAWRSGSKAQLMPYARELAERGHVAFAINYRLAPDHIFPAQIDDCQEVVRYIVANADKYKIDTERFGAIGYSAGGHLVAMLGTQGVKVAVDEMTIGDGDTNDAGDGTTTNGQTNGTADPVEKIIRFKAVAPGGAPCDFRAMPPNNQGLAFWLGGTPREQPDNYKNASPAAFVTKDACPMFFFHGEEDELVNLASPKAMMEALKQAGVENDLHIVEGAGHIGAAMNPTALNAALDFLDAHLKSDAASDAGAAGQ